MTTDGVLNVDWDEVKIELFNDTNGLWTKDANILKAFVRTQIYRPLYFKHDNYATWNSESNRFENFTSDASKYWCSTKKRFQDHDQVERDLVFATFPEVDKENSGLDNTSEYDISDVEYSTLTNHLKYEVHYKSISITNNKFVYKDIEFYVVEVTGR